MPTPATTTATSTVRQDGSIDRAASPSWQIDYMLLASLMAEHFDGQLVTIPLTEKEVDMVCTVKDKQAQMAYLIDEITDLDKDDPSLDRGQPTLLNDEGLLTDVQRRWHRYNGNGGDHAENLREAIKVTIHARFPQ